MAELVQNDRIVVLVCIGRALPARLTAE